MPRLGFLAKVLEKGRGSVMNILNILIHLLALTPALLFWIAVIIFGAVMLGRDGGRSERFLIIGASLKIVATILTVISPYYLFGRMENTDEIISVFHWKQIFTSIIHAAGITCFIYAFWIKFYGTMKNQGNIALPQH
jgi:hypothetical protein